VRAAVCTGTPHSIREHPITRRLQYLGPVLHSAASVSDMGSGGQVRAQLCIDGPHICCVGAPHGTARPLHCMLIASMALMAWAPPAAQTPQSSPLPRRYPTWAQAARCAPAPY
jgi:hypothetical protein